MAGIVWSDREVWLVLFLVGLPCFGGLPVALEVLVWIAFWTEQMYPGFHGVELD